VSEETEGQDTGAETVAGGVDPVAVALALGRSGALDPEAVTYLKKQGRLADLQHEVLASCEAFEVSHLRWRRFGDQMKGALQIMGVMAGLCVVAAIGVMIWNAAHADGTVVESFTVPPDLAARGLTGEVIAGQVQDKLSLALSGSTVSVSQGTIVSNSRADDIKVEIPETGISLGEVYRFLREWLGSQTMVGGEVFRTPDGLSVTIRIAGGSSATYSGKEAELDALLTKAAEHAAEITHPTGYAIFLYRSKIHRIAEALPILQRIANDPLQSPKNRASAFNSLAIIYNDFQGNSLAGLAMLRRSLRFADESGSFVERSNLVAAEFRQGHAEIALGLIPTVLQALEHPSANSRLDAVADVRARILVLKSHLLGDFAETARLSNSEIETVRPVSQDGYRQFEAQALALQHDGGARRLEQQMPLMPDPVDATLRAITRIQVEAALENWPAIAATEPAEEKTIAQAPDHGDQQSVFGVQLRPWLALAKAELGDTAGARALIGTTPSDCYDCVRTRGTIASLAAQWTQADYWFARATAIGPSLPFAETEWGQALLKRGQPDAAIAKFTLSNQKGPHFADPLEGWGEALMAKNQSHLALARFAEAEKYAPNWGRLHLKWGEALVYEGKKDEAKNQFARAALLDLTAAEKVELEQEARQ
jgi:hypothetical protein